MRRNHSSPLPLGEGGRRPGEGLWICAAALFLFLVALPATPSSADDSAAQLATLSAEQKEELLRKKDRFDSLPQVEQDRLRALHQSLASSAKAEELSRVMDRYCEWLKTLTSAQRAELRDLPADKRIARIKELLQQQAGQRFQEYAGSLPAEDREAIYRWLEDFITRNQDEIISQFTFDMKRRLADAHDEEARKRMLIMGFQYRRPDSQMPMPTQEDFGELLASLSPATRKKLEEAKTPEEKQARARELVRAAIFSRVFPPVSDEELRKFYVSLPADARDRLEGLDPEQTTRELRRMYYYERFRERGGPWGGGPWTGFGGPRPGGPGFREGEPRDVPSGGPGRFGPRRDGQPGGTPPGGFRPGPQGNGQPGPSGQPRPTPAPM
jgi:hypothetical protein